MALTFVLRLTIAAVLLAMSQEPKPQQTQGRESEPWVMIDRPPCGREGGAWNPQVCLRADGTYMASVEMFGEWRSGGARVYRSTDRGLNWTRVAAMGSPSGASLFELGESLYLLGVDAAGRGSIGDPVVVRSTDSGTTWSNPSGETTGLLRPGVHLVAGEVPVVIQRGRVWRPFGREIIADGSRRTSVLVASAPTEGDLLQASAWTWSEELSMKGHDRCEWRDCTLIPSDHSTPILFIPGESREGGVVADISDDGLHLVVRVNDPQWHAPERAASNSLPRDPRDGQFLALTFSGSGDQGANVLLESSKDLSKWQTRSVLLSDFRRVRFSFMNASLLLDGDDLVAAIHAKEFERDGEGAQAFSADGSFLFLRVPSFRERSPQTPPLWESGK